MKGVKLALLGIAFILTGGFFIVSQQASLGGFESVLFIIGIALGIAGLFVKDSN